MANVAQASINNTALFLDFFKQGVELNAVRRVLQGVYVKMTFVEKRKTDVAVAAPIGFLICKRRLILSAYGCGNVVLRR